jgi:glycosyltransferase involved in cell wall biosynthesis
MKKVLFVSYYWPPSGKATLHWPLKMIKYLPDFGWEPSVITVEEDTVTQKDESLLKDIHPELKVIKTKAFDPFTYYRKFTGKEEGAISPGEAISKEKKDFKNRLAVWIRMNFFVPDARVGWVPYAVSEGSKYLSGNKIDAIITIGPPHSSHLVGKNLSKKFAVPHVPVLIDPWTDIFYYKDFKRGVFTRALDGHFEKSVLKNAKEAVFITQTMRTDYEKKYPFLKNKSHVLYWGYNEEDFNGLNVPDKRGPEEIILHTGNFFDSQNPVMLWPAIKKLIDGGRKIKLKFTGTVGPGIKRELEENGLLPYTEYLGLLPYKEVLREMLQADYLLVCAYEKRHVPGKLFEYLRAGKKIIAFGDENEEVSRLLKENNAGVLLPYNSSGEEAFNEKTSSSLGSIYRYDRRAIAQELSGILNKL